MVWDGWLGWMGVELGFEVGLAESGSVELRSGFIYVEIYIDTLSPTHSHNPLHNHVHTYTHASTLSRSLSLSHTRTQPLTHSLIHTHTHAILHTIMSKLLVVFGATGQQGGSIITTVLNDAELSKQYKLRAITRDPSSASAQALHSKGVEVVKADVDDTPSLKSAMSGAHTVFGVTVTVYDQDLKAREVRQGKALADAAVAAGASYLIYSTLSHTARISHNKYPGFESFESKAEVEDYIRGLRIRSAFFAPGNFMQNYSGGMAPRPVGDGTYAISGFVGPGTKLPCIDTLDDTGKYIGAILADPDAFEGKVLSAATDIWTYEEVAEAMSRASGKTVKYKQIPLEVWKGFLHKEMAENLTGMFQWIEEFGYYGPDTESKVKWTAGKARGKLTTLEEYFEKCPLNLQ